MPLLDLLRQLAAAGVLDHPNDAFYLSSQELGEVAAQPRPLLETVARRKQQLEHWRTLTAPASVGAPLVIEARSPQSQVVHRFFFGTVSPTSHEENVIRGHAASKGRARGRARIIHSLSEADRLQAGDILVCKTTAPPWTPLFALAAAVVTETGGVLSHSAICAREYAIPCVVGARGATSRIPEGALITVDGDQGRVVIEE